MHSLNILSLFLVLMCGYDFLAIFIHIFGIVRHRLLYSSISVKVLFTEFYVAFEILEILKCKLMSNHLSNHTDTQFTQIFIFKLMFTALDVEEYSERSFPIAEYFNYLRHQVEAERTNTKTKQYIIVSIPCL